MSDEAVAERLQSILINAAEGRRSVGDDAQYDKLRRELVRRFNTPPQIVATHPTVDSFAAFIRGISDRRDRVVLVREQFELLSRPNPEQATVDASTWGAPPSKASKLKTVRSLLPLAQAAVDSMIATLSEPNPNYAPIMEHKAEAITHLRELHRTLGELLAVVDAEGLDVKGQRLLAEAASYAKRAARSLRDDPMPYLASALLLGIFEACGLPGIAGYLVGITQNVKKHSASTST